jgi:hypothetical protein
MDRNGDRRAEWPRLDRGVYWAAALKDGNPQAYAVNGDGNEIRRLTVERYNWRRGEAAVDYLWRFLDLKYPSTTIGIVRPLIALPEPVRSVRDPYDPYSEMGVPGNLRLPW